MAKLILLMEEIPNEPPVGCIKTVVNNGINYQPQLVSRISVVFVGWQLMFSEISKASCDMVILFLGGHESFLSNI